MMDFLTRVSYTHLDVYKRQVLLDTYNTLKSGLPNAIRVAKEYLEPNGYRLKGVRIDSGDMAYLSKKIRKALDEAGMQDCQIVVSNSLDEFLIESLLSQGAQIDSLGVGENLVTSKSSPVFGGCLLYTSSQSSSIVGSSLHFFCSSIRS